MSSVAAATCFSALQRAEIAEISTASAVSVSVLIVSVLFNEPKLLKCAKLHFECYELRVSVLFNEPKLLKWDAGDAGRAHSRRVSVLFNEPKLLKSDLRHHAGSRVAVSVLFNEPKLLK